MKTFGIGLLGFGTVGAGVVDGLRQRGELIAKRLDFGLRLSGIADIDLDSDRGVIVDRALLTHDAEGLVERPDVDIVVELIGGVSVARELVLKALRMGKPVVTANKALLAEHGEELYTTAEAHHADLFFEASVGGGIPVIRSLREGLIANHIESVYGILNGTCNYVLTRMERDGLPFDEALAEAQRLGYAEADPALDVDGYDTAHKAVILASLAYGLPVPMAAVHVEGIRGLDVTDIRFAAELNYRIKLLAIIKHQEDSFEVRVHPTLVPVNHPLAAVSDAFNAVLVRGDIVGDTMYYGRGAGRNPTASAVLADIADVARNLAFLSPRRVPDLSRHEHYGTHRGMEDVLSRYYLRVPLLDQPGSFSRVADILGRHGISIDALIQKEQGEGRHVPVILLTEEAREGEFRGALKEMQSMKEIGGPAVYMRIENFS